MATKYAKARDVAGQWRSEFRKVRRENRALRTALRSVLDLWHGGHLEVRPEASGAWHAAVRDGEGALAQPGDSGRDATPAGDSGREG